MPSENGASGIQYSVRGKARFSTDVARVGWVDSLKGIGILLVVLGHALGGLIDAEAAPGSTWLRPVFAAIYIFHMPLFFFLTGLFVARRVVGNPGRFRQQLFTQVAWPYFLWGGIQIIAIYLAGTMVNHPSGPLALAFLQMFHAPPSQFWFLYALFFLHGLSLLMGRNAASPFYFLLLLAAGSIIEQQRLPGILQPLFQMAPFYGLGVFFGPLLLARAEWVRARIALLTIPLACAAGAVTMAYSIDLGVPGEWPEKAAFIAADMWGFENFYAAITISAALIYLTHLLGSGAPRWLVYCGRQTMPIFVMHILFIASTRIFLLKFDPTMPIYFLLPLLCAVGIVMPLVAAVFADRLGLSKWVGFR